MSAPEVHPRHQLSETLGNPIRFSLVAALASLSEADFATLRDLLEVSDSVLSRQTFKLEQAGIVEVRKGFVGKRPRTWLSLTSNGRKAWNAHVEALQLIIGKP